MIPWEYGSIFLVVPLIFGELVGLGMGIFGRLFGGGGPAVEAYDMKAPPPVPISEKDAAIGVGLIALGIYLKFRGK